jgi:hypothetical protein
MHLFDRVLNPRASDSTGLDLTGLDWCETGLIELNNKLDEIRKWNTYKFENYEIYCSFSARDVPLLGLNL